MIETFNVDYRIGRVCYLTEPSPGKLLATIESYDLKCGFTVQYEKRRPLHVGDWVNFRGKTRINLRFKKNGEPVQHFGYYHDPKDGNGTWMFFELEEADAYIVAPPSLSNQMQTTMIDIRRHVDSWAANNDAEKLYRTIKSLLSTVRMLETIAERQSKIESDRNARITIPEITI